MTLDVALPEAPAWRVDWDALDARFPWIRRLREVPQDPVWHAEGDVWIHTRMVCEALVALPAFRALPAGSRLELWLAALLHDVAKPDTTRVEGDRVRSPHHAPRGAVVARELLWRAGLAPASRERVCGLVRHHQLPVWAVKSDDGERRTSLASHRCRLDHLALLAEADIRGRVCRDADEALEAVALFVELADELGCLDRPRAFASDHTRLLYLRGERPTAHAAYDDTWGPVLLMSGPPGAGKTSWLRAHAPDLPVVSLDAHRHRLGVGHGSAEGRVRQAARAEAREHLRARQPFAWDATNLLRTRREPLVQLFRDYGARVEIVPVEVPVEQLTMQNRERSAPVPEAALERMLRRWELPDVSEAHALRGWPPGSRS